MGTVPPINVSFGMCAYLVCVYFQKRLNAWNRLNRVNVSKYGSHCNFASPKRFSHDYSILERASTVHSGLAQR